MTVITKHTTRGELESRRTEILDRLDLTLDELLDRRRAGTLTAEEWEAWEELDGISFLLGQE